MRVVSKFHDYYDGVQRMGQDQSVVYVRERKVFDLTHNLSSNDMASSYWGLSYIIGFCGKIYPCLNVQYVDKPNPFHEYRICYSIEDVDDIVESKFSKSHQEKYWRVSPYGWVAGSSRQGLVEHVFKKHTRQDWMSLFAQHNTPLFLLNFVDKQLIVNPMLRTYDFARVVDPYTAYQSIYSYITGVLRGPVMPIPQISDEIMCEAKGFDKKWSFRKEPQNDKNN